MKNIHVTCDGDWNAPEVQVSGTSKDLADLGLLLINIQDSVTIHTTPLDSEFYPVCVNAIDLHVTNLANDRLAVAIDEATLGLSGTNEAFKKLGESLVNIFDDKASIGDHFHLDYYEGNEILNETNCHLIFLCDR